MSQGKVRRIYKLNDEETSKLSDIGARAFKDVIAARAMVGGNDDLLLPHFRALVRAAGLEGEIYVVENNINEIVSYSVWFPPGRMLFGSEEQRKLGFNELQEKIDAETQRWWKDTYIPSTTKWGNRWLPKPPLDCWWLAALATDPAYQRRGYGSLLMKHAIDKIPAPNIIALVSTSEETADFYQNIGFPIRDRMVPDMPSKVGDIPVIGHYREAK